MVGFHADTVRGLRAAFAEAVNDCVDTCAKIGKAVEEPASSKRMLRVATDTPVRLARLALNVSDSMRFDSILAAILLTPLLLYDSPPHWDK